MIYEFKCDNCDKTIDIYASIKDGPPKSIICENCEGKMYHNLKGTTIVIPDYMKAGEGDAHHDMVYRMAHAPRPSGRSKVYY